MTKMETAISLEFTLRDERGSGVVLVNTAKRQVLVPMELAEHIAIAVAGTGFFDPDLDGSHFHTYHIVDLVTPSHESCEQDPGFCLGGCTREVGEWITVNTGQG